MAVAAAPAAREDRPDARRPAERECDADQLLAVYSAGLGIPFLMTGVAINSFFTAFAKIRRYYHAIEIVSGGLLVAIGLLIFTDRFTAIARVLEPYLPTL